MLTAHHSASLPSRMAKLDGATFGDRVRFARERLKGWSQDQLADDVDVTTNYVARVERGEARPSEKLITRLANALGVSRDDLGELGAPTKDEYPARAALLADPEFKKSHPDVRARVLGWPDADTEWTTRQWYEAFSTALRLQAEGRIDPKADPAARPARKRTR